MKHEERAGNDEMLRGDAIGATYETIRTHESADDNITEEELEMKRIRNRAQR